MNEILIVLAVALAAGKGAGVLAARAKLPAVLGEILAGLLLANLFPHAASTHPEFFHAAGELGVILLLFSVGLESTLGQVAKVGARAFAVAVLGVVAPFALTMGAWKLGWMTASLGSASALVPVFVGATLTATSVGITARILSDAALLKSRTGQIILNAAVIDDVLGLLILAGVSGAAMTNSVSAAGLGAIVYKSVAFFAIAIPLGMLVLPRLLKLIGPRSLVAFGLCVCFVYAWAGTAAGLAPIVGAFFAGLLVDEPTDRMKKALEPIVEFLAPLFFVLIGAQVKVSALVESGAGSLGLIALLFAIAIAGKLVCGLIAGSKVDKVAVGLGMAPRGEVGLIFAMTGKQMGVIGDELFGVVVIVVLLSTLLPAVALERWLARKT